MNGISDFNGIITYIEENLTGDLPVEEMAKQAKMSVYEFRRIFSFVAGIPISEYIRRRRLSAAAEEIVKENATVTSVALKYGYDNPSSFSRAFREFHGISPSEAMQKDAPLNLYTRLSFDLQVSGGREIRYVLRDEEAFGIRGYRGTSGREDTECCEAVWNEFYESGAAEAISGDEKIYAAYENGRNGVTCTIGTRTDPGAGQIQIPACRWVCFSMNRTDDPAVNERYQSILFGWFRSSGYRRAEGIPNLEVYPADMEKEGFCWEIRFPIEEER